MRRFILLATAALVLGATGCAYHVPLVAPTREAPVAEREAAYARLMPVRLAVSDVTFFDRIFARNQSFVNYLELADGTRVAMPEDILPVVRPDSVAALAVHESLDARRRRRAMRISAPFVKIAGGLTMLLGLFSDDRGVRTGLLVGGGVMVGGGLGLRIGSHYVRQREEDGARRAFVAFDAGLREFLDVCPPGDQHGICGPPAPDAGWEQQMPAWERAP
jgi:hypothetical protein